ncbi:MANSC domain-containing protein 4-like [Pleuronectes platessa]|uniref:MANSC domain-containing protein 4-like n=1 Tax=Pleuronectes platessa TaxID=8262 RepID=UPI00232A6F10|nr:MANSC domain-containing protein 4-like [Pleuronectes platessa]
MNVACGLLTVLLVACHTESRCSPTSYYKNCWIRRFPGIFIDIEESQRRGAQLLEHYQEETALQCSRTCCLTRNFSCNLAIFHYDTSPENVNCFHLHCPTLESCILSHRGNVVLYNVTKGVDPDLLVFGKYFTSNVRVLPHHYSRANVSEPLPPDKRQFIHPPPPAALPLTSAPTGTRPTTARRGLDTTTTTLRSTSQATVVPTTTTTLSATSPALITDQQNQAQATAPTTSTNSPAPSFTAPPPSMIESTLNPEMTSILSAPTAQPSTSALTQRHPTTSSRSATSPPTTTGLVGNTESSKQYPNDTEGPLGRNHTAGGDVGQEVSAEDPLEELGPGWHVAAHTLLVAVAICITVLLSCCCSILLVASWRAHRRRMGRYRTSWRGRRGSMRLIKYVLVRERS